MGDFQRLQREFGVLPSHLVGESSRRPLTRFQYGAPQKAPEPVRPSAPPCLEAFAPGCIVRRLDGKSHDEAPAVVFSVDRDAFTGFRLEDGRIRNAVPGPWMGPDGKLGLNWEVLFTPPDTHVHRTVALPRLIGENALAYRDRTRPLLERLDFFLDDGERFERGECGVFVEREAVERFLAGVD